MSTPQHAHNTPTGRTKNVNTDVDLVVIGSGAAGLATATSAAAEGLSVLVIEKDATIGGTSAISGGWAWVPGNRYGMANGDTRDDIEAYIQHIAGDAHDADRAAAFLDRVPAAMDFFEHTAGLDIVYDATSPDYQMDAPGAKKSGRAVTFKAVDARVLADDRLRLRPYHYPLTVFGYMPEIGPDLATFIQANRSPKAFAYVVGRLLTSWSQTLRHKRSLRRTNGNALMTQLLATARRLGIEIWTDTRVTELTRDPSGTITGVQIDGAHTGTVTARRAVVLASGGFGGDPTLRAEVFRHDPSRHYTPTQGHHGDSARLAKAVGGTLDTSPHSPAAWAPVTRWKNLRGREQVFPHLRAFGLPGLIAVNRDGRRFGNESLSYHDFGRAMLADLADREPGAAAYGYLIGDRKALRRYGIGYAKPAPLPAWYYRRVGYLVEAATVADLAGKIDVPADALTQTLRDFNANAEAGHDPDFGRGSNWYHHFKGDPTHKPNPNLAPLTQAPFYAVRIELGDLGTFAGLSVDHSSRVLDADHDPIPGLYAVGSAAVSPFMGGYPGYGAMIGPAMVFGYAAGHDIATSSAADDVVAEVSMPNR